MIIESTRGNTILIFVSFSHYSFYVKLVRLSTVTITLPVTTRTPCGPVSKFDPASWTPHGFTPGPVIKYFAATAPTVPRTATFRTVLPIITFPFLVLLLNVSRKSNRRISFFKSLLLSVSKPSFPSIVFTALSAASCAIFTAMGHSTTLPGVHDSLWHSMSLLISGSLL